MVIEKLLYSELRKKVVNFDIDLTSDEKNFLQTSLSELESVTKVQIEARFLGIEYEFPITCFTEVWQCISDNLSASHFTFLRKLNYSLLSFAEHNEKEHLLYPRNWHTYVEDIYIHYYDYHQNTDNDVRKQLWRRYKKNS
jgi:hypothetical protein